MKKSAAVATLILSIAAVPVLSAQEVPEFPDPKKEHEWLKRFVGEWETSSECPTGPNGETMETSGTMTARMLGGFWVVCESTMNAMDTKVNAIQTIGYDPEKEKYVGTWVDSMMNHLWQYEGSVDASGKKLILDTEGPNLMKDGETAKFRDAYEFKSPDHIVVTSSMQGEDGEWVTFMTGEAHRKK